MVKQQEQVGFVSSKTITATCPEGTHVLGGGASWGPNLEPWMSVPLEDGTGWAATLWNDGSGSPTAVTYAICA